MSKSATAFFNAEVEVKCLSFEDVYGGKLCAALDRQHPRDLFDVKLLLDQEGISDRLRKVFLVYLIQADRPALELLAPRKKELEVVYQSDFAGMTSDNFLVTLADLIEVQESLAQMLVTAFTSDERDFLLSVEGGAPDWEKLGLGDYSFLPGVSWKLLNIKKMDSQKRKESCKKLAAVLG